MKYFRASPKPLPLNEREGRPFRTPLWEGVPQVSAGGVEPFDELGVGRHDLRAAQLHGGREQAVVDGPGLARDGDGAWDAVLREGATGMTHAAQALALDVAGLERGGILGVEVEVEVGAEGGPELGIDDYEAGDVGQVVADDEDLLEETVLLDGELDVDGRDLPTGAIFSPVLVTMISLMRPLMRTRPPSERSA